jgi:hypothetical protein
MKEPGGHSLRLLREMRQSADAFEKRMDEFVRRTDKNFESMRNAIAGESVLGRYAAAGVEDRLTTIEKRLSTLERQR